MSEKREPIGYVEATVRFNVFDGDALDGRTFDWFEYREPGINANGDLGVCCRPCRIVGKAQAIKLEEAAHAD